MNMRDNKKPGFSEDGVLRPDTAPTPIIEPDQPFIQLDDSIARYAEFVNYSPILNESGLIHVDDYIKLLKDLKIPYEIDYLISKK